MQFEFCGFSNIDLTGFQVSLIICTQKILSQQVNPSALNRKGVVDGVHNSQNSNSNSGTPIKNLPTPDRQTLTPDELKDKQSGDNLLEAIWYSPIARYYVPDKFSIGLSGDVVGFVGLGSEPVNITFLTRGESPGIYTVPAFNVYSGLGANYSGGIAFSKSYYTGNPRNITADMLIGYSEGFVVSGGFLGDVSIGGSYSSTGDGYGFINASGSIGLGEGAFVGYQRTYNPGYGKIWSW